MNAETRRENRLREARRLLSCLDKSAGQLEYERLKAKGMEPADIWEEYPDVYAAHEFYERCVDALLDEMDEERIAGTDSYALDRDPDLEDYEECDPEEDYE